TGAARMRHPGVSDPHGRCLLAVPDEVLAGEVTEGAGSPDVDAVVAAPRGGLLGGVRDRCLEVERVGEVDASGDRREPGQRGVADVDVEVASLAPLLGEVMRCLQVVPHPRAIDHAVELSTPTGSATGAT